MRAHLWSVNLKSEISDPRSDVPLPALGLVASGGHTALYDVRDWRHVARLGGTIDDAVGEAYDKVAAMLGLGYPGGPLIDKLAATGNPNAIKFPRPMLGRESLGLLVQRPEDERALPRPRPRRPRAPAGDVTDAERADVCAGFQAACVDVIVRKLKRAAKRTGARSVIVGGGVSANAGLRAALSPEAGFPLPVFLPGRAYCTDNAAMIAGLADVLLAAGQTSGLDLDAATSSADAA